MIATLVAVIGFASVTPSDATQRAVANSPDVAAASARAEQSAAAVALSRSTLFPSLASSYAQAPQGNPPGPSVISRLVTVGVQTNVADFLAYGTNVRQNVLLLESSRADLAVATRDERIKTIAYYFDALKARAIAIARDRAVALARAEQAAANVRFRAGDAPRLDVLRADVAVAQAVAGDEGARAADDNATDALRVETALPLRAFATTADAGDARASHSSGVVDAADAPDAADAVAAALASRAEIASATSTANAAEAGRRIVAGSAVSGFNVTAGYTAGSDSGVPVGAPSIAAQLTVPLGPGFHERVRLENARVAEARARVQAAKRSVTLEVASSARTLASLVRAASAATSARIGADAELAATDLGYRNGASTSLEVSAARQTDVQATVDELGAVYDLAKADATLRLQTGR